MSEIVNAIVPIEAIQPHPRNYKVHPPLQIADLKASHKRFSQYRSVVIWQRPNNAYIQVAGHGILEAMIERGVTHVRADILPMDTPEEDIEGIMIADNQLPLGSNENEELLATLLQDQQEAGFDLHSLGTDDETLRQMLEAMGNDLGGGYSEGAGGDDYEVDTDEIEIRCKRGELWQLGKHRLLVDDSTKAENVARLMDDERPFIMVTDPPYGVDYDPEWRNEAAEAGHLAYAPSRVGQMSNDDRIDWSDAWKLFTGDIVYCWHAGRHASIVQTSLESAGFITRCQIIWAKSNFPISRGHYHWRHEPCWYLVRKGATARWAGDHTQTTLWEINLDKNVEGGHSTQKPLECMARPIRNHGTPGDIVYDPFLGSGTTLIASERLGRRCYAMEIDEKYATVCLNRWEAETGQTAQLLTEEVYA